MKIDALIDLASNAVYPMQGFAAVYGVFCIVLIIRQVAIKQLNPSAAGKFLAEIRDRLAGRDYEGVQQLCDSPPYWSKVVPQLILVALANGDRPPVVLRRTIADKFEREILAEMEYRMSWVNTIVKSAPMLGLLGTVLGMISAFGKIATAAESGNAATSLASDISFALITTAVGLIVAIPLIMVSNTVNIRIGRMQDLVQQQLGEFLEMFDIARGAAQGKLS